MYGWDSNEIVNDLGHLMEIINKNKDDYRIKSDIVVSFKLLDLIDHDKKERVAKYREKFSKLTNDANSQFDDNCYKIKDVEKMTELLNCYITSSKILLELKVDQQVDNTIGEAQNIVEKYLLNLDTEFYNIYKKNYENSKIKAKTSTENAIFAAQITLKKSYITFNDSNKLSDLVELVHQMSHVIDYEYSDYKSVNSKYWYYLEVVSQLNELFFLDYLIEQKYIDRKTLLNYHYHTVNNLVKQARKIKNNLTKENTYSSDILYFESSFIAYNLYGLVKEKKLNKADLLKYIIKNRNSDFKKTLTIIGINSQNNGYIRYINDLKKMIY